MCIYFLGFISKKGSPVHVAPAYAETLEGSDHFESYVCNLSPHFYKRLFLGLLGFISILHKYDWG
jgi:hypothetical protein